MQDHEHERLARLLEDTGEYRVLRRFPCPDCYCDEDASAQSRRAVFLDVETTGTDPSRDEIIELAMVPFEYSPDGRVYRLGPAFSGLREPKCSLDPIITEITGLTDDQLRGKSIDRGEVAAFLDGVSLVIAHNARFDRPFFERAFPELPPLAWACSQSDVPWHRFGVRGRKLEYLANLRGYFYDGHRAEIDCRIGIDVLACNWGEANQTALAALLESSSRVTARLWATGSPFERKDDLKKRGYRFDGRRKVWYRDLPRESLESEREWLAAGVYEDLLKRRRRLKLEVSLQTARERYTDRWGSSQELWLEAAA